MATKIDICNSALIKIGQSRISSITEDTKAAIFCNQQYATLRDEVLYSHPWNFAVRRVELGLLATAPAFEFDNQFQLPSNCLRVLETDDTDMIYVIEGRNLLTNWDTVKIKYIERITDESQFNPAFAEALALRMAWDLAYPLVESVSLQDRMAAAYEAFLAQARSFDAQEGTPEEMNSDTWLNARL